MIASLVLLLAARSLTSCVDAVKAKHVLGLRGVGPEALAHTVEVLPQQHAEEQSSMELQNAEKKARTQASDDILELNVGGELMSARKSTFLKAPKGSVLYSVFGGQGPWSPSESKDSQGRIFLDYTPRLFGLILSYLRTIRLSGPRPVPIPAVPQEDVLEFMVMLDYFGLAPMQEVLPQDKCTSISLAMRACYGNARVETSYAGTRFELPAGTGEASFVGQESLAKQPCAWTIRVEFSRGVGIHVHPPFGIGVIGNPSPTIPSCSDNTSYTFGGRQEVYMGGKRYNQFSGWDTWHNGDVAIIKWDAEQGILKMYHMRLGRTFEIKGIVGAHEWRIHIHSPGMEADIYTGDTNVLLTEATSSEAALVE